VSKETERDWEALLDTAVDCLRRLLGGDSTVVVSLEACQFFHLLLLFVLVTVSSRVKMKSSYIERSLCARTDVTEL
jgi:hypothetical protein